MFLLRGKEKREKNIFLFLFKSLDRFVYVLDDVDCPRSARKNGGIVKYFYRDIIDKEKKM